MAFSSSKVKKEGHEIDIIKSSPFLARAMYISPGGTLLDKYNKETEFYNNVEPILLQLVKDIQELWVKAGGRICGENTKYIVNHLKDEYENTYEKKCEVKAMIFHPGQAEYRGDPFAWGMTRALYEQISEVYKERRKWRDDLWGVGHTMGVIYHALPLFIWKNEKIYITVESNLCNTMFMSYTQLHITRSLEEMKDLLAFRYSADSIEEVDIDKMGGALTQLTRNPNLKDLNDPHYQHRYRKQRTIPMKLLKEERKQTLKTILKTISKIPIRTRAPITSHTFYKTFGFRGTLTKLRHTLKTQVRRKTPYTKKIRVSKATFVKK